MAMIPMEYNGLKKTTIQVQFSSGVAAGAHGYIRAEHTSQPISDPKTVIAVNTYTVQTSAAKGMQITPDGVYTENNKTVIYFTYYVPETLTSAITWNFDIWYYE